MKSLGIVILAAGKGTRLLLDRAKALAPLHNRTLIDFVLDHLNGFVNEAKVKAQVGVVVGHKKETLIEHLKNRKVGNTSLAFPEQIAQNGTADALKCYFENTENAWDTDYTLVLCADTPLVEASVFKSLYEDMKNEDLDAIVASFQLENPMGYGRIKRLESGGIAIVEQKDASDDEKRINEVNSGVYIFKTSHIKNNLFNIDANNEAGEYYLTDLIKPEYKVRGKFFEESDLFIGVNTLDQLAEVARYLRIKKTKQLRNGGVIIHDNRRVYIENTVEVGDNSMIWPGVYLMGKTIIGKNCEIEPGVIIKDSIVGDNTKILANSYLEKAKVGNDANIGPYARLRPEADIGNNAKIGNFVEVKKSKLHDGVKVSHLSYVGDAEIGKNSNIGCGFITCNYDGVNKHHTKIGEDCFIGSDNQAVAPITIGNGVFTASGSTLNQDIPDDAFAIARAKQVNKAGMAKKFQKKK